MSRDPLALDAETMRQMGYAVVDLLVERITHLAAGPALRTASRADMAARLQEPPPEAPVAFSALLERLNRDVLPFVGHFDHPRFFGYIPGAGTWPGALGDLIAAALNIDSGSWRESAGPTQLELTVLDWFRQWLQYPESAAGVLVSGGSAANLTAVACAREAIVGPMSAHIVAYTSDQTHSSLARAMRNLGFRPDQIRVIATDSAFRLRTDHLAAAMDADLAAGRLPFLVSANAGTTNTGAVDDLPAISAICRSRNVWMHVDGAYGAFAVLSDRGRAAMPGLDLADSVTLDPHKWLAMPFEVGCLMVRDGPTLERAFELHPEYLQEAASEAIGIVNFADRGLQLTRSSRAIKVWLALQTFGIGAFRAVIDRALDQVAEAERLIRADPRLELVTPASLGVLTFRRRGEPGDPDEIVDRLNEMIVARLGADGDLVLTSTVIRGRYAIRFCVLNHTTSETDIAYALDRVATAPLPIVTGARQERRGMDRAARQASIDLAWLAHLSYDADRLRRVAAFATVSDDQAADFLGAAHEESVPSDHHVTDRFAHARVFYLVAEGRLSVEVDGREVNVLLPGDHFGEIGAIDWGRDFSYGRTATVIAREPTRLLAFPASALHDLMRAAPAVDREIRRAAAVRLDHR